MTKPLLASSLAFAALASAQAGQAQQQACVDAADLADTIVYAMPIAYDASRTACANRFSRDGFMATRGDDFAAKFRARQDAAWPGAFRMLKTFVAKDGEASSASGMDMSAMLSTMPPEALRPFVDALVGQMIAQEIKGDTCNKIERGAELLSPLPADNIGGLVAFIAEMADLKNPPLCPAAAAGTAKKK
ncbi:hypothetical protein CHX26_11140 [Porphyrobacter sp. HT-58-2]|uniref:hypothetical protein n=1 Tax=Porphyrobacter sp. HT-58-2 TaxID=2023229 RepID=UPI000CDC97D4|nr:hypothetical protein [Porphyrobacter sp. HT-58-2]AUX69969.1 hypothetical protein CHX26_11140 [Porphyrobacter sp. HT-58-2]